MIFIEIPLFFIGKSMCSIELHLKNKLNHQQESADPSGVRFCWIVTMRKKILFFFLGQFTLKMESSFSTKLISQGIFRRITKESSNLLNASAISMGFA